MKKIPDYRKWHKFSDCRMWHKNFLIVESDTKNFWLWNKNFQITESVSKYFWFQKVTLEFPDHRKWHEFSDHREWVKCQKNFQITESDKNFQNKGSDNFFNMFIDGCFTAHIDLTVLLRVIFLSRFLNNIFSTWTKC